MELKLEDLLTINPQTLAVNDRERVCIGSIRRHLIRSP